MDTAAISTRGHVAQATHSPQVFVHHHAFDVTTADENKNNLALRVLSITLPSWHAQPRDR